LWFIYVHIIHSSEFISFHQLSAAESKQNLLDSQVAALQSAPLDEKLLTSPDISRFSHEICLVPPKFGMRIMGIMGIT